MVIADTSPLNYLVLIGSVEILPRLYQTVTITDRVLDELTHPEAPARVAAWAAQPPEWIKVGAMAYEIVETALADLGAGEQSVIALAEIHRPDVLLLVDDAKARSEAVRRNIATVGTLGILRDAASLGLVDLGEAFERLSRTNFRVRTSILKDVLRRHGNRGPV